MQIIKMLINYTGETVYLPLIENMKLGRYVKGYDQKQPYDTPEELLKDWRESKWGFTEIPEFSIIELLTDTQKEFEANQLEMFPEYPKTTLLSYSEIGLKNPKELVDCAEFGIKVFKDLAFKGDLYNTPWDKEPTNEYYSCWFALDCQRGVVYSKDFAYFTCNHCSREICEQNPANGWMMQVRNMDKDGEYRVCLKCYEELIIKDGMNEKILEDGTIDGMFGLETTAKKYGYSVVEGFDNYHVVSDISPIVNKTKELTEKGHLVIVSFDRMAIGGLEGYVTLLSKYQPTNKQVIQGGSIVTKSRCDTGRYSPSEELVIIYEDCEYVVHVNLGTMELLENDLDKALINYKEEC